MALFLSVLPIFIIILLGYICAKTGFLKKDAADILSKLIFYIIMPVTLFIDVAKLPATQVLNWPYLAAYFVAASFIILLAILISYYGFKRKAADLIINTMAAVQTNTAYLAIPIFLLLFNTLNPVAGVILIQAIFNFVIIFSLEYLTQTHKKNSPWKLAFSVILKTPILIGIILGLLVSLYHVDLPKLVQSGCGIVRQSAPFLALFTLGLSLGAVKKAFTRKERDEACLLIILKSIIHPTIAFIVGHMIFHLPTFWLNSLILMAAMPTAKNCFIFAKRYQTGQDRANFIVISTTVLSILIINLILLF